MKQSIVFVVVQFLTLAMTTQSKQNLTDYLVEKYSKTYQSTIKDPVFFHEVLNGTVDVEKVAYFFEQDTQYGRGFTTLCGNTLNLLAGDLMKPTSNLTLSAINNLGQTASGLADEDGRLTTLRNELLPGSSAKPLSPSPGTLSYVKYMKNVSSAPHDPFEALVCSWTMGKVCELFSLRAKLGG
ncbi:hypothetical protein BT63DRAFT_146156 [Microthyrium microscopicum]|uniref:Uncharacterized protein n=1 Tax=Microthyrium microscopicum TaxID=703497 RepID=A0A6A6ULC7_9PEZI|nr:hypothetical protein BT63DRAFT_146156 [Microthyrium microscopicum]